jgi:peptide-methionine (S)-S-oxide reductase
MPFFGRSKSSLIEPDQALPGREREMQVPDRHEVLGTPLQGTFPDGVQTAIFGMGCFWGAERVFWKAPGVYSTAVGYAGGITPNPSYEEVCSGRTAHSEVVLVAFDSALTSYEDMLKLFWENHDPTQGMRQGNDAGTQYRSMIIWQGEDQHAAAQASLAAYQKMLTEAGYGTITTELQQLDPAHPFFYAEAYHQQYLAKQGHVSEGGYCSMQPTGVSCPIGLGVHASPDSAQAPAEGAQL